MMDWASLPGVVRMGLMMFFTGRPRGLVLAFLVILFPYDDYSSTGYNKRAGLSIDFSSSWCGPAS